MTQSLQARYAKEREGVETIESEIGFATYLPASVQAVNDALYLRDIYVLPEQRHSGEATKLADQVFDIAKARNCKFLLGSVSPEAKHSTASLKVLLSYGFELLRAEPGLIWFIMRIE